MSALLLLFVQAAIAVAPLNLNITLDFDPLDPDFEQLSRIHIWSPQTAKLETEAPTQHPTQKPTRQIIIDDDTLLDQAIQRKTKNAGSIKIFMLEARMFVPKFESQLIHQRSNDHIIVTKRAPNEPNPFVHEYYGTLQFSLQKSSALLLIVLGDDWRHKLSLFASAMRQWMSRMIDEHKECDILQVHFTDSLLTTIKSLPSRNMSANQLTMFRCLLRAFKGPPGYKVTKNDVADSLFADSLVMEFIKSFSINVWTLTWNSLHNIVHELLTKSNYALAGVIPDRPSLIESVDALFDQYRNTIHAMYGMIRFETNDFLLNDNHTVDDAVIAVNNLAKLDKEVMMLLDPLMIGKIVYDLYSNETSRDISVVIMSKSLIAEIYRFLNKISNQSSVEYFTVMRRPVWQKGHAKGGFVGFNVNKMTYSGMFMTKQMSLQVPRKPKSKKKKKL